jgi:nucleoside-diphosphate-sugar epimerase
MKVLVLGGTRFMGRYVARALLDSGWEVTVANRGTRTAMPAVESICCDRSLPGALDVFRGRKFDAVIDFSAYPSSWVAQAGALFAGNISRYIFISSCAVYSESQRFPVTEDFPLGPPHPHQDYAAEKIRSEQLLVEFSQQGAFQSVSCRLPFVLGPDNYEDRESFVFSRLHAGAPVLLTNGGNALYSFVYAGDVAQALLALIRADDRVDGQAFNITLPQATTARGFVEACAAVTGRPARLLSVPVGELGFDQADFDLRDLTFPFPHFHFYAAAGKLGQFTGFSPQVTLPQMLQTYHAWWLARGDLAPRVYAREQAVLARLGQAGP